MIPLHQEKFHAAARLVKSIGTTKLENGETVAAFLSVDGISLWEAVSPVLAAFDFPSATTLSQSFKRRARLYARAYLAGIKYKRVIQRKIKKATGESQKTLSASIEIGFIANSGYMFRDVIEPVVKFCVESGKNVIILQDGDISNTVNYNSFNPNFYSLWQDWHAQDDIDLSRVRKIIQKKTRYLEQSKQFQQALCEQQLIRIEDLKLIICWLFRAYIPMLLYYFIAGKRILNKLNFSSVISPDVADSRIRIIGLIAQSKSIPWMDLQFGIYGGEAVEWCFAASDKVAVWGDASRKLLLGLGVAPHKIIITGSPRFDDLSLYKTGDRNNGPQRILFASMYSLTNYSGIGDFLATLERIKKSVFDIKNKVENVSLVVKLHPIEEEKLTKSLATDQASITWVSGKMDIREQIRSCDIFVTLGSTSTMDALIAGKIVIYPAYDGLVWWDDIYINAGVVLLVNNEAELLSLIRKICDGSEEELMKHIKIKREIFLRENIYLLDGNASQRIVNQLHGIESSLL